MPRSRKRCYECGKEASQTVYITRRGHCLACAARLQTEAHLQLTSHSGPVYETLIARRWPR